MTKHCRIELLGQLRARVGHADIARFRTYKTGALLAYLAYQRGRPVPREELVEMLWPDSSDEQARNSLSQSVSSLRHQLEPPGTPAGTVLEASRHSVRIVEDACETDLAEFRDLVKRASQDKLRGDAAGWEAKARSAVRLFAGEFLPGVYEDWTLAPREHLREEALAVLDDLVKIEQGRGNTRETLELALRAVTIDPTRESSHQAAILAYDALGQPEAALRQYRELERALAGLGLKPSDATRALVKTSLARERDAVPTLEGAAATAVPSARILTWVHHDGQSVTVAAASGRGVAEVRPGLLQFNDPSQALAFVEKARKKEPAARFALTTGLTSDRLSSDLAAQGQVLADEATAALLPGRWTDLGLVQTPAGQQRLFATTETAAAPPDSRTGSPTVPATLNRFFGRERELGQVCSLLQSGSSRLVTLTGPGGMGKTRLSVEAARALSSSVPTVYVPLENTFEGNEVWAAVASALGIAPAPRMSVRDQVLAVLQARSCLLVLDNFEQLCDSGGQAVVQDVLGASTDVRALVSSRRRLGVEGETEIPLAPLPSPQPGHSVEEVAQSPAVALFLDRARSVRPDFQLTETNREAVVTLCDRLEGIPLALELAAARSQTLTPRQILERFDQRLDILASKTKVERHRSLRKAIDWTYAMLDTSLQTAFRALAVFRGGWTEGAAEALLDSPVTLDVLAELQEFSLVRSEETAGGTMRFDMLETLRDFGRQASSPGEWSQWERRHADSMLALVQAATPELEGPGQIATLEGLEPDRSNIAAAVEWALGAGETALALCICAAAWRFWHLRSHIQEGRRLCEAALSRTGGEAGERARVLNAAARLAYLQGDYDVALSEHEQALELAGDDPAVRALALNGKGSVAFEKGQYDEAVRLFKECLELRKALNDDFGVGNALSWLGIVYTDQTKFDEARQVLAESLELRRGIGDLSGIARSLNSLGIVSRRLQEYDEAARLYGEALEIQRQTGDVRAVSGLLSNLAMIAQVQGDLDKARSLLEEAHAATLETGDKWGAATVLANLAGVALDSGDPWGALDLNARSLAARREIGNKWGMAFSLEGSARALLACGQTLPAITALAGAESLRKELGSPLPPSDKEQTLNALEAARKGAGEETFHATWDRAARLPVDDVVGETLKALLNTRRKEPGA